MIPSIYIASPEGDTGKLTVALGVVDLLSRQAQRVGVFRPVGHFSDKTDYVLELLLQHDGVHLTYDECIGTTYEQVHNEPEAALNAILTRYHEIARKSDVVVIVGTDYTDVAVATELAFNARVAANLGAPVLLVVSGNNRSAAEIHATVELALSEIDAHHTSVIAIIANRCEPSSLDAIVARLRELRPAWAIPEDPFLIAPTIGEIMAAVDGELIAGDPELLSRESLELLVGSMNTENLLQQISEGATVITSGDRGDILLGLVSAHVAEGFPSLSGIVLSGRFPPPDNIFRLVTGLGSRLPIIRTQVGTFRSASRASRIRGRLSTSSQRKTDTALALFENHVDGPALLNSLDVPPPEVVTPLMFEHALLDRARAAQKHIVLPEGNDDRILRAASTLLQRGVAKLTILGDESAIGTRAAELSLALDEAIILNPRDGELLERFSVEYAELRKHKGMTVERAREIVSSVSYFGTMMVHLGLADGMVSGAVHTTAHTIRPAFEIIKSPPEMIVSSVFLMCLKDRVLVYGDCAVNPHPTEEQLADIAISSAKTAQQFGIVPRIAMLSYSTGSSGAGAEVEKVRLATELVRQRRPDLSVEGPIQYDAAVDVSVAQTKLPHSAVAGRATVFVFPDLNTGNNTYKAVQRSAGAVAIGPVLQGLRKPVNDLSRGALVQDIVNTVAITAIQAQALEQEGRK